MSFTILYNFRFNLFNFLFKTQKRENFIHTHTHWPHKAKQQDKMCVCACCCCLFYVFSLEIQSSLASYLKSASLFHNNIMFAVLLILRLRLIFYYC